MRRKCFRSDLERFYAAAGRRTVKHETEGLNDHCIKKTIEILSPGCAREQDELALRTVAQFYRC